MPKPLILFYDSIEEPRNLKLFRAYGCYYHADIIDEKLLVDYIIVPTSFKKIRVRFRWFCFNVPPLVTVPKRALLKHIKSSFGKEYSKDVMAVINLLIKEHKWEQSLKKELD